MKGYTHEGLPVIVPVESMVDLAFVPFAIQWTGWAAAVSLSVEYNKTPSGKKRPYVVLQLFGLHIQSGWLF